MLPHHSVTSGHDDREILTHHRIGGDRHDVADPESGLGEHRRQIGPHDLHLFPKGLGNRGIGAYGDHPGGVQPALGALGEYRMGVVGCGCCDREGTNLELHSPMFASSGARANDGTRAT